MEFSIFKPNGGPANLKTPRSGVALWLVLVVSKFVVLTLEDLFFGDAVELGGFVPVTLLILVLMVSRAGVRRLLTPPSASRR